MNRTVAALAATVFVGLACSLPAAAQDRGDRADRSLRLDNDGIRNEIREDRLKAPVHTFDPVPQQVAPQAPAKNAKSKANPRPGGASQR